LSTMEAQDVGGDWQTQERKPKRRPIDVIFKERGKGTFADFVDKSCFEGAVSFCVLDRHFFAHLDEALKERKVKKLEIQEFQSGKFAISFGDEVAFGASDNLVFARLRNSLLARNVALLEVQTSAVSEGLRRFLASVPAQRILVSESYKPISLLAGELISMLIERRSNGGERRVNIARTLKLTNNALFSIYSAFGSVHSLAVTYLTMRIDRGMRVSLLKMIGVVQAGNAFFTKDSSVSLWLERPGVTFDVNTLNGKRRTHYANLLWIIFGRARVSLPKVDDPARPTFYVGFEIDNDTTGLQSVKATVDPSMNYNWR
ncbi:hypothetical protein PFISCL1PPCAC_21606, partial [Pristionchus fissidentatus]